MGSEDIIYLILKCIIGIYMSLIAPFRYFWVDVGRVTIFTLDYSIFKEPIIKILLYSIYCTLHQLICEIHCLLHDYIVVWCTFWTFYGTMEVLLHLDDLFVSLKYFSCIHSFVIDLLCKILLLSLEFMVSQRYFCTSTWLYSRCEYSQYLIDFFALLFYLTTKGIIH